MTINQVACKAVWHGCMDVIASEGGDMGDVQELYEKTIEEMNQIHSESDSVTFLQESPEPLGYSFGWGEVEVYFDFDDRDWK